MSNFLLGGRLGDLIHALYVVKNTPGKHDLFITDRRDLHSDGFLYSLEQTYKELYPIIIAQSWCNSFQIYTDEVCVNLSLWRRYAYSASWAQMLSNVFEVPVNGEPWVKTDKIWGWENVTVVHCSLHQPRRGHHWEEFLTPDCVFVGTKEEYDAFGFNMDFYPPKSLLKHFKIINSCKLFIGNQSAPLAMAHALGVPRLAMLNETDKIHYVGEEKFCKNFWWIAENERFTEGLVLSNEKITI